jgi:hypothetical protein
MAVRIQVAVKGYDVSDRGYYSKNIRKLVVEISEYCIEIHSEFLP